VAHGGRGVCGLRAAWPVFGEQSGLGRCQRGGHGGCWPAARGSAALCLPGSRRPPAAQRPGGGGRGAGGAAAAWPSRSVAASPCAAPGASSLQQAPRGRPCALQRQLLVRRSAPTPAQPTGSRPRCRSGWQAAHCAGCMAAPRLQAADRLATLLPTRLRRADRQAKAKEAYKAQVAASRQREQEAAERAQQRKQESA
jgi:hypothetical protein